MSLGSLRGALREGGGLAKGFATRAGRWGPYTGKKGNEGA
jgi:hypothetical protein